MDRIIYIYFNRSKCGEILGYDEEREKQEYEEYTSVSFILSSITLVQIR